MSELDFEEPPALDIHVPRVRNWWTPSRYAVGRAVLRRPRGVWIPLGLLPLVAFIGLCLAAVIWAIWLVLLIPYFFWVIAELLTYNKRYARALQAAWVPYMAALHEQDPPD